MFRATRISINHQYQYNHHKQYTTNNSYNSSNNPKNPNNNIIIICILGLYFTLIKNK